MKMKIKKKKELLKVLEKVNDFRVDKHKIEYPLNMKIFILKATIQLRRQEMV